MEASMFFEVGLILVLILANGFFAGSEIAVVSARRGRLEQLAARGSSGASKAIELMENPNRFLSTVQVGITLIGTLAAAFGGDRLSEPIARLLAEAFPAIAGYAQGIALGIVVLLISYFSLILGELVPKRLALQSAEAVAARVAPFMAFLSRAAGPVVGLLSDSTNLVLRLLGRHNVPETPVTEDDVLALVREGTEEGTVEASEQELIASVFAFTDRMVRSLMTPRTQVVALDIDTPLPEVARTVTDTGYSRIPVYEESLDHIVGILNVKDLIRALGRGEAIDLRALLRPPIYLLESQRAVSAFQQLKQQRSALAIVLDEYGQVAGLISMEDMLEELVGDIDDEYDEANESIVQRDDGSFLVDGLLPFEDVRERVGLPEAEELVDQHGFETVAGFVLALLGRIPRVGESAAWGSYTFEVVDMDGRRIDKILIREVREAGAPDAS